MEEQKRENKEELQQETAEEKNPDREILPQEAVFCGSLQEVIFVYTGYRLCASVISGAEDSGMVFLAAGGIFVVIGAVLLIMAIVILQRLAHRNMSWKKLLRKKRQRKLLKIRKLWQRKKCQLPERAHLAENLDDAPEEEKRRKIKPDAGESKMPAEI